MNPNPFNLTGWEAMLTTAIVCGTVILCAAIFGSATVSTADRICKACEEFSRSLAQAIHDIFGGKKS